MDPPPNEEAHNTQENVEMGSVNQQILGNLAYTWRQEIINVSMDTRDSKCHHVSEISDSDKENTRMNEGT